MAGVEVRAVERLGKARFMPQSPFAIDALGAVMACCVGHGAVAVFDTLFFPVRPEVTVSERCSGWGMEKSLEDRKADAVGDATLLDMLMDENAKGVLGAPWWSTMVVDVQLMKWYSHIGEYLKTG